MVWTCAVLTRVILLCTVSNGYLKIMFRLGKYIDFGDKCQGRWPWPVFSTGTDVAGIGSTFRPKRDLVFITSTSYFFLDFIENGPNFCDHFCPNRI